MVRRFCRSPTTITTLLSSPTRHALLTATSMYQPRQTGPLRCGWKDITSARKFSLCRKQMIDLPRWKALPLLALFLRIGNMSDLHSAVSAVLTDHYTKNATRIRELAAPFTNAQFWQKPFPFGNSFGHLVLHLTGNLNYYVGAQIAQTGYIRDRPREFTDPNPPFKDEALKRFDDTVDVVLRTIRSQSPEDWSKPYTAVGSDSPARLDIVFQCATHLDHHIGQMIYLGFESKRK